MENLPTRIEPPNQDSTQHDSYMATLTMGGAGLEPAAVRTLSPHPIPLGHPTPLWGWEFGVTECSSSTRLEIGSLQPCVQPRYDGVYSTYRQNTSTHSLATPSGRHASAGGRQAGKSPHYRPTLRPYAQPVLPPRKPPAPPAVPGTRPQPQTTPMPCPARARTSTHTTRHAQHAPIPANRLNAVPSMRPHSNAVPSTHPYLNAHRTSCPACARFRTPRSSPLPRPSVRQGVLSRDLGPQVRLV